MRYPPTRRPDSPNLEGEKAATVVVPERYVAYLFDDVHITVSDIQRLRDAALRHIATMKPSDRAAIYTMSGFPQVDFTDDQDRLKDAILRLRPNIMAAVGAMGGGRGRWRSHHPRYARCHQAGRQAHGRDARAAHHRDGLSRVLYFDPIYFPDKQEVMDLAIRNT
jgi:hypothetical protein